MDVADHDKRLITDATHARKFIEAGNAYFTIKSDRSQTRFTYRVFKSAMGDPTQAYWRGPIRHAPYASVHWVGVLTGPDNESSYTRLGMIDAQHVFKTYSKARTMEHSPSFRAFDWFWRHLTEKRHIPQGIELRHEGRCGKCGRRLTVPSSIDRGIGPECAKA